MKPQIEHPMISHKTQRTESAPEMRVHTVMPPEDEAELFARQMQQNEIMFSKPSEPVKAPVIDGVLDREMKKRDVFNKLVLLKEDHYKEVTMAGLTFKLKLLTSTDNAFIMKEVRKEATEDQLAVLSLLVLSASIEEVNGVKFEEFFTGPASVEEPILRRYWELRQWQRPVINALQKVYSTFQSEVEQEYTKDFLVK